MAIPELFTFSHHYILGWEGDVYDDGHEENDNDVNAQLYPIY